MFKDSFRNVGISGYRENKNSSGIFVATKEEQILSPQPESTSIIDKMNRRVRSRDSGIIVAQNISPGQETFFSHQVQQTESGLYVAGDMNTPRVETSKNSLNNTEKTTHIAKAVPVVAETIPQVDQAALAAERARQQQERVLEASLRMIASYAEQLATDLLNPQERMNTFSIQAQAGLLQSSIDSHKERVVKAMGDLSVAKRAIEDILKSKGLDRFLKKEEDSVLTASLQVVDTNAQRLADAIRQAEKNTTIPEVNKLLQSSIDSYYESASQRGVVDTEMKSNVMDILVKHDLAKYITSTKMDDAPPPVENAEMKARKEQIKSLVDMLFERKLESSIDLLEVVQSDDQLSVRSNSELQNLVQLVKKEKESGQDNQQMEKLLSFLLSYAESRKTEYEEEENDLEEMKKLQSIPSIQKEITPDSLKLVKLASKYFGGRKYRPASSDDFLAHALARQKIRISLESGLFNEEKLRDRANDYNNSLIRDLTVAAFAVPLHT